jgi:hypothetical protein
MSTPASASSLAQSTTPAVAKTNNAAFKRWDEPKSWSNMITGAVVSFGVVLGWFS